MASEAQWRDIDVDTLTDAQRKAYEAYKTAQRQAAELRTQFEAQMNKDMAQALPQGHKLVFGYRFGKLSAAVVKDESKPASGSKAKQSLADFIAAQAQSGWRA